jgi:hypothetical protein
VRSGVVPPLLKAMSSAPRAKQLQYRLCGCLLALALDNTLTQDTLARESVREGVRNALMNNPSIGFDGQFESLKDWVRPPLYEYEVRETTCIGSPLRVAKVRRCQSMSRW